MLKVRMSRLSLKLIRSDTSTVISVVGSSLSVKLYFTMTAGFHSQSSARRQLSITTEYLPRAFSPCFEDRDFSDPDEPCASGADELDGPEEPEAAASTTNTAAKAGRSAVITIFPLLFPALFYYFYSGHGKSRNEAHQTINGFKGPSCHPAS